jgi:hypothetical protein
MSGLSSKTFFVTSFIPETNNRAFNSFFFFDSPVPGDGASRLTNFQFCLNVKNEMSVVAKKGQKDALALFPWLIRQQIGSI